MGPRLGVCKLVHGPLEVVIFLTRSLTKRPLWFSQACLQSLPSAVFLGCLSLRNLLLEDSVWVCRDWVLLNQAEGEGSSEKIARPIRAHIGAGPLGILKTRSRSL